MSATVQFPPTLWWQVMEWDCPQGPYCDNKTETSSLAAAKLGSANPVKMPCGCARVQGQILIGIFRSLGGHCRPQPGCRQLWALSAGSYCPAPAGSTGAPFAAPCTEPKKLNEDFSFRAVSQVLLQKHILSSLSPSFSLSRRQINSRDSKPGTKF